MSMNLHVDATRAVTVHKTGEQSVQVVKFDLWQTPTKVTNAILDKEDKLAAYIDWAEEQRQVVSIPVYASDDIFCEGPIVGYEEHDTVDEHINELTDWCKEMTDGGYTIEFYEL
jgi:hypothetical protein